MSMAPDPRNGHSIFTILGLEAEDVERRFEDTLRRQQLEREQKRRDERFLALVSRSTPTSVYRPVKTEPDDGYRFGTTDDGYSDVFADSNAEEDIAYRVKALRRRAMGSETRGEMIRYSARELSKAVEGGDFKRGLEVAGAVVSSIASTGREVLARRFSGLKELVVGEATGHEGLEGAGIEPRKTETCADEEEWAPSLMALPPMRNNAPVGKGKDKAQIISEMPTGSMAPSQPFFVFQEPRGRQSDTCTLSATASRDPSPEFLPHRRYLQNTSPPRTRRFMTYPAAPVEDNWVYRQRSFVKDEVPRLDDDEYSNIRQIGGFEKDGEKQNKLSSEEIAASFQDAESAGTEKKI